MTIPDQDAHSNSLPQADEPSKEAKKSARLVSLDAFRGLTILLMLLVNNIALDVFTPRHLMHAEWNKGIHLADLVAPWFLFCVGIAIPFSTASFEKTGKPSWQLDLKILKRGALLILLGCIIDSSLYNGPIFCLDVLQIIGLAYIVGALLYELPLIRRMLIAAFMLVSYWAAIKYIPVPGMGAGVFEESHNLISNLNQNYLNALNLAGLTSIIPTAALVLIGTAIGDLLRKRIKGPMWTVAWLMIAGVVLTAAGIIWNLSLSYNKPLWTPSYILLSAGTGSILLGTFYLIIDIHNRKKWSFPLVIFGSNAIVAYVLPILAKLWVLQKWNVRGADGHPVAVLQHFLDLLIAHFGRVGGGWAYTLIYIAVWWLILWQMYKRKLFLRV